MLDPNLATLMPQPRRRKLWPWIAAAGALVIVVAVIGALALMSGKPAPQSTPAPPPAPAAGQEKPVVEAPPPPPPVVDRTYRTPKSVVAALVAAGIDCGSYEAVEDPIGALARGSCYVNGGEVGIGIYRTATEAEAQPETMAAMLAGVDDVDMVVGRNWTANCDLASLCQEIAAKLGGEYVHIPQ